MDRRPADPGPVSVTEAHTCYQPIHSVYVVQEQYLLLHTKRNGAIHGLNNATGEVY